jgi:asparagine synthase (glutamine-hydrolysing)
MSDIFVAAGLKCEAAEIARQLSWTPQTKAWSHAAEELIWVVARVDDPILWAPAHDRQSGVWALLGGRITLDEAEWKAAEALPYAGGLACKLIIDRWLKGGASAIESLNGGAQITLINERERTLHVWTDRMGFYPAFAWTDGGFVLSSHPDVAAKALERAGHPLKFDALTMAEFLRTGTSVHPHTYWHGIRHLDAATHFVFDYGTSPRVRTSSIYWQPAYLRGQPYLTERREIVDKLAMALTSAVRRRTLPRLGKIGVLLSAGADSRTALFGACDPSAVTCYTFYDEKNAEFCSAELLAAAARAEHIGYQRHRDYYIEHAAKTVRITGGMWSVDSGHYAGLLDQLSGDRHGVVMTGCYTDYLLKGLSYNRRHRQLLGRSLPVYVLTQQAPEFYQPFSKLESTWSARVDKRLQDRYARLSRGSTHPASVAEYLRLSPIVREADAAGRLLLCRTTPLDLFTADNDVVEMASSMHPEEKVSGIAFGMAVEKVTGPRAHHVLNNNYNARVGASEWQRVASFVKASALRKIRRQGGGQPYERNPNSVATVGSWPYFPRVIKLSERLRAWRREMPKEQQELLFGMLGAERQSWSIIDWGDRDASLFLRLYTASLWLAQNSHALTRIATV